jgi:SAM-dependent methyltransferase
VPLEDSALFHEWFAALEARHLANLRVQEVTRALRALSSVYVQRKGEAISRSLDSAGKRAAFALFYGPLHFLTLSSVLDAVSARGPRSILDVGCGTGAAGAAWAARSGTAGNRVEIIGLDRHPWAVEEARWTYRFFGLDGSARVGDAGRMPASIERHEGFLAAYVLNELPDPVRVRVQEQLLAAARAGKAVVVIEPIARSITPWWDDFAQQVTVAGGRSDEWRVPVVLPEGLKRFDRAAGLRHAELTARTIMVNI